MTAPPDRDTAVRVVAHQPDHRSIRLWIDTRDESTCARLRVVDDRGSETSRWPAEPPGQGRSGSHDGAATASPFPTVRVWDVTGLEPGSAYSVEDDRGRRLATFRTLPERLPLTIAVGSCYSVDDDRTTPDGRAPSTASSRAGLRWARRLGGWAAAAVPHPRRPDGGPGSVATRYDALSRELERVERPVDLKILLGDQVYVDQPPWRYYVPLDASAAWRRVADRYRSTWSRLGPLLACGANICVSEDHEYWNNYPSVPLWLRFWSAERLESLREAADAHRSRFQLTAAVRTFRVGTDPGISFFVADTRCRRSKPREDRGGFMEPEHFDELTSWVEGLDGPGVAVLGQPLLASAGRRSDTTLASYPEQHGALCDAIARSTHDVVVVCGDVHFGRLSVVPLATGRRLVEVVSSPLALLAAAGNTATAPSVAPRLRPSGPASSAFLDHCRPDGTGEDHVTILTFEPSDDHGVSLRVTPYLMRFSDPNGIPVVGAASWEPIVLR